MWSKQYIFKLTSEFSTIAIFYFASEPQQKRMVCSKMALSMKSGKQDTKALPLQDQNQFSNLQIFNCH